MEKIYPIDIAGINNIGLDKWLGDYYVPVTGREYGHIHYNILNFYTSLIRKYDNTVIYWLAVSSIKMPIIITEYISFLLASSRLQENGYKYLADQSNHGMPYDIKAFDFKVLPIFNLIDTMMHRPQIQDKLRSLCSTIKHNLSTNGIINRNFIKNIFNPSFCIGNRCEKEVLSFCNEENISPINIPYLLSGNKTSNKDYLKLNTVDINKFVQDFLSFVKQQYPIVENSLFNDLENSLNEYLTYSLFLFLGYVNSFRKFRQKNLLAAVGIGKPYYRLFCSAWRYSGGEVVGFTHGNSYCCIYSPLIIYDGISVANKFIVSSIGNKKIIKQGVKDFSYGLEISEISHLKSNHYKSLFKKLQNNISVKKVRKVMIVGNILSDCKPMDVEYHPFAFLHYEIRLIRLIRNAGYHVIYKPRLETFNKVEDYYECNVDEIIAGRFEDVYNFADCLLFTTPYSTTFGFSLLTNKPIVYINVKGYTWYPRAFELIKKRCSVVEAESVDGRTVFEEQEVLNAIEESANNINYDLLYEFVF